MPEQSAAQSSGFDVTPPQSDDRQDTSWSPSSMLDVASSSTSLTETNRISERPRRQGRHSKLVGVVKPMRPRLVAPRPNQRPRSLVQAAGGSTLQPVSWGTSLYRASHHGHTTSGNVSLPSTSTALHPNNASHNTSNNSDGGVAEGGRRVTAGSDMFIRLNRRCSELGRRNEALEQKLAAYRRFFSDKDNLKSWIRRLDTEGEEALQSSEEEDARQTS